MKNKTYNFTTKKTTIVLTSGNDNAQNLWLVLHGYGQHVEEFSKEFTKLESDNFLVFPEALNTFYLKSGRADTGSSWMTKYRREYDIQDNIHYLNSVYSKFLLSKLTDNKKFYAFGFSQGAATLVRWLAMNNIKVDKIILWGAVFPPDIHHENYLQKLKQLEWLYFIGTNDEFISNEEKQKQKEFFIHQNFSFQWIEYDGKHAINTDILKHYST